MLELICVWLGLVPVTVGASELLLITDFGSGVAWQGSIAALCANSIGAAIKKNESSIDVRSRRVGMNPLRILCFISVNFRCRALTLKEELE